MNTSQWDAWLGTRWSETGASLLLLTGPMTEIRVTAPPRDPHTLSDTSRILRIRMEGEGDGVHVVVELSHR